MIEIAALAVSVVNSFLVPLLKSGAEGLTEELQKQTTETAAKGLVATAQRLWQRVRGKTDGTDDNKVVELFQERPDMMKEALQGVVRQLLENDPAFRQEASTLLEKPEPGTSTASWQIMADTVGVVNAQGAHVSGGQIVGMQVGAPSNPSPQPRQP
jgi:hypothetical protein